MTKSTEEKETSSKQEPANAPKDTNQFDTMEFEMAGNSLRALTVIYGFFFVFLSAMVAGSPTINSVLDPNNSFLFYVCTLLLAIANALIGIEIFRIMIMMNISFIGEWGLRLLIASVPSTFVFVIGITTLSEISIFDFEFYPVGNWIASLLLALIILLVAFKLKKDPIIQQSTADKNESEKGRHNQEEQSS